MTVNSYQQLEKEYITRLSGVSVRFVRYLYNNINWESRLIGIKGERGVGKSTLLLQRIKLAHQKTDSVFYVSLDNIWFQSYPLTELVEWLYPRGVRYLFLDEVHKLPNWSIIIKNLYDIYSDLNIVYTGSSMLEIDNSVADLSRRQTIYTLHGMSFREYLAISKILDYPALSLSSLLESHQAIAMDLNAKIPVLKHFDDYLQIGYYPFHIEAGRDYLLRLGETARLVIETDVPAVENLSYATLQKAKQLLAVVSGNVPLVPNISKLAAQLETTRDQCLKLLYLLDRAGLLLLLTKDLKDYKHLVNPEKIYLGNTNLMYALGSNVNEGNLRETFFINQLSVTTPLKASRQGDFVTSDGTLFEVGGRHKTFDQIKDLPTSYLVIDDIEIGSRNRIPLWLFGLLY